MAIQIPRLQNRSVERLVGESPSTAVDKFAMQHNLTSAAAKVAYSAIETHEKFTTQQEDNNYESAMFEFEQTTGTQPTFDSKNIPSEVNANRTSNIAGVNNEGVEIDREAIPAYEVYPQMYRDKALAEIEARGKNIPAAYRADWIEIKNAELTEQHSKLVIKADKEQRQYNRDVKTYNYEQALLNRDYKGALRNSIEFPGTELEQQTMIDGAYRMREFDRYDDQLAEKDVVKLKASLKYLRQPLKDYQEQKGRLNADERKAQAAEIEAALSSASSARSGSNAAYYGRINRNAKDTTDAIEKGRPVDAEKMAATYEAINRAYALDPNKVWRERDRLVEVIGLYPSVNAIMLAPPEQRAALINDTLAKVAPERYESSREILMNADKNARQRVGEDTRQFAIDTGFITGSTPIDFSNPDYAIAQLTTRKHESDAMVNRLGSSTGLLTQGEVDQLQLILEEGSLDDQMFMMSTVAEALGPDSAEFWGQISEGGGGTYAVAGSLYGIGQSGVAQGILRGKNIIKEDSTILPTRLDTNRELNKMLEGAYPVEDQRAAHKEAITNLYANLSHRAGDYSGTIDIDRYEKAISMVTGGIVDLGGVKTVAPSYNKSGSDWDSEIRDTHYNWWKEQGGVQGYKGDIKQLRSDIRSGKVKMVNIGAGKYHMYSTIVEGYLFKENSTELFVYKYDENAQKTKRYTSREIVTDILGVEDSTRVFDE